MDTVEKQELAERTRDRNALTWLSLGYGGLMAPLADIETELDLMARPSIFNYMAVSDEAWGVKERQRDKAMELSQAEVDQNRLIADAKAATGRSKIAIEMAADEYVISAKVYDARVKGLIMGAKEYAALVEQYQLAVEEDRAGLAVDKEALRLKKVRADTYLETIAQAQVEADIAKAQVDVAKAHVRTALANIEAGEAEIKLIRSQTEVYLAEAEKATLQADVATIFAEIMTKKLSETKLAVGKAEISAGYHYIQSKLDDILAQYNIKELIEKIRIESEVARKEELDLLLVVEKAFQNLKLLQEQYARLTFIHEGEVTQENIIQEETLRNKMVVAKRVLNYARTNLVVQREAAQNSAAGAVSGAQVSARDQEHESWSWTTSIEHISG